jgi:hypothetical protein
LVVFRNIPESIAIVSIFLYRGGVDAPKGWSDYLFNDVPGLVGEPGLVPGSYVAKGLAGSRRFWLVDE